MNDLAGNWWAFLFLLPFALVGLAAAGFMGWHVWCCQSAQSWVEVPCHLIQVEMKRGSGKGGPTYRVIAEYQYALNQIPHTGNRVWFGGGSDNVGQFQQRVYEELLDHKQRGVPFRCYVDPNDPNSSVLYRDIRYEMLLFASLFVVLFGGVGVGGLVGLSYVSRKARQMNQEREHFPDEPWKWDRFSSEGVYKPWPTWIGIVLVAMVWNAFTWVAMWTKFLGELRQGPSLAWLFLVFPIIGIVAAWKALTAVLKRIRFGVPPLTVRPWPLLVGDPFDVSIDFPAERPASADLMVELRVFQPSRSKGQPDVELFQETQTLSNSETLSTVTFSPPETVPRTALMNDEPNAKTAKWQIKVTGSDSPSDFEATYELVVFKKRSDSTLDQEHRYEPT